MNIQKAPSTLGTEIICVEQILQRPRVDWLLESENVDLVVDILSHDKDHIDCAYYFADHAERIIFWIDDFSMNKLTAWRAMPGITTATQIKRRSNIVVRELRSLVMFSVTGMHGIRRYFHNINHVPLPDTMTSPTTTIVDSLATDIESSGPLEVNDVDLVAIDKAWGVVIGFTTSMEKALLGWTAQTRFMPLFQGLHLSSVRYYSSTLLSHI
ncbi:hypothetical protein B0H13DRAFT_1885109 [Mycena leptocephala]|nr:hypothetical protein B0H13DRAFT_1885109 [Mycena leptocephala]